MENGKIQSKRKVKLYITLTLIFIGLTTFFYKKVIVLVIMAGGWFIAPEASAILKHYCFGNGDTLIFDSSYL